MRRARQGKKAAAQHQDTASCSNKKLDKEMLNIFFKNESMDL